MVYTARKGSRINDTEAQVIGEELEKTGEIDATEFVKIAGENQKLHPFLTWDNKRAGQKYRENEARTLMASITVIIKEVEVRAFIPHPNIEISKEDEPDEKELKKYCSIGKILDSPIESKALIMQAKHEAISWKNRWKNYAILDKEWEDLRSAFEAVSDFE